MRRLLTTVLTLVGLAVLLSRVPATIRYALLHGTGTIVRHQQAWVSAEEAQS